MPKIPANFLDGVFYLYTSVEAAERGDKFGGTGFFVSIPSSVAGTEYLYAVSNWHVAVQGGASVIRVNNVDGGSEIIDLGPEDWEFDPHTGHDIAVALLRLTSTSKLKYSVTPVGGFVTEDRFSITDEHRFSVGDDIFMVGRFVDHDGGPTNQPAARFGHVSINPSKLRSALGKDVDTICLDTNSRTGFSGSPVYIYRTGTSDLEEALKEEHENRIILHKRPCLMLLGVHTGQFPEIWNYREAEDAENEAFSDGQIRGLSGMTRVAPAWGIRAILDMPKLRDARDRAERAMASLVTTQVAIGPAGEDSGGFHFDIGLGPKGD